jgi:hypothetical protein
MVFVDKSSGVVDEKRQKYSFPGWSRELNGILLQVEWMY